MSQNPGSKLRSDGTDFTSTIHHDTYDFINPSQFALTSRAVLITGASKGIGRATALSYAKAGTAYIAIAARSGMEALATEMMEAAAEAGKAEPIVLPLSIDVTDQDSVKRAAQHIEEEFGRLDVLVNNAGYMEEIAPIAEQHAADWWRSVEVNMKGPYLTTQALLPLILKSTESLRTILNVSSVGAHVMIPGASGYQIAKMALLRFGEFLNLEYKDQNLLSFGIHPGAIMTELASGLPKDMHGLLGDTPQLAGDSVVWLTAERREWLAGRYVSCTWDLGELVKKRAQIEGEDLLKVRMDVGME